MSERKDFVSKAGKYILAFNLGTVVRTLCGGLKEGKKGLEDTYRAVAPFSPIQYRKGSKLLARIPEVALESLAPVPGRITLDLRYTSIDGATPIRDVLAILALAIAQKPTAALEFGTYFGTTTANLALNLPGTHIHTIDLPEDLTEATAVIKDQPTDDQHLIEGRQLGKAFRNSPLAAGITQHQGDTATYDYSVIHDNVTVFLVDGSHTYEYAKSDTLHCFKMARGEALYLWHDCDRFHPGVTQWLVEMIDAGLPVVRIQGTSLACVTADSANPSLRKFITN